MIGVQEYRSSSSRNTTRVVAVGIHRVVVAGVHARTTRVQEYMLWCSMVMYTAQYQASVVAIFDRYTTILYGIQGYTIRYIILAAMLCSTRSSTRSMTQHTEAQLILYVSIIY